MAKIAGSGPVYFLYSTGSITRERIEPTFETSDGTSWTPLAFHYKPGPVDRPPPFVAPHQPRVDFLLWFYGLSAVAARELPSERDQNFELASERGALVLKIGGPAERPENLDLQNAALEWVAARAPELAVPRLVRASDGRWWVTPSRAGDVANAG